MRANASGAASRGPARLRGEPRGPPFFSHVFVITIIRPSQKETSPPVNPRSGFKLFSVRAPEPPKKQSYVYFEPSKRDLIRPRISTSALFDIYCRSTSLFSIVLNILQRTVPRWIFADQSNRVSKAQSRRNFCFFGGSGARSEKSLTPIEGSPVVKFPFVKAEFTK